MNALLTALEKLTLNAKLILGFSSGMFIAAAIGLYSLSALQAAQVEMEKLYDLDLLGISHTKEANINLIYMGRALRQALIAQDDATRDKARTQVAAAREALRTEMAEARKRIFREENIAKYEQFMSHFAKFNENVEHALSMMEREKTNASAAAQFITSADFAAAVNAADDDLTAMTRIKERGSAEAIKAIRARAEATRTISLLLLGGGLVFSMAFGVLIGLTVRRPNERLRVSVETLAGGDVGSPIPHTDYPNEIGVMARAIGILQKISRQANEQHWVKSQVSEISSALQQTDDFHGLTQTALSKVAPVIGAGYGAFYVVEEDGNLSLLATYGYRERKHLSNSFRFGEGLVGQCAMEKVSIMLTAPKDYIRIGSGLGEGLPTCVIVLPVIRGDRVLGVLELASFQQFGEREKAMLEALLPIMAINMEILDRNLKTRELLASTQEQAERMEKQAAQLEEQAVEMEAQQAELLETENWFRSIIEAAPDGMLVADAGGRILLANPELERLFGYASGELIGGGIEQLVPERVRGKHPGLREAFMAEGRSRAMGASPRLTGVRKDGSEVAVTITLSPLPPRGARGKCVSVAVRRIET